MGQCLASESERRQMRRFQRAKTMQQNGKSLSAGKDNAVHPTSPNSNGKKVKKKKGKGKDEGDEEDADGEEQKEQIFGDENHNNPTSGLTSKKSKSPSPRRSDENVKGELKKPKGKRRGKSATNNNNNNNNEDNDNDNDEDNEDVESHPIDRASPSPVKSSPRMSLNPRVNSPSNDPTVSPRRNGNTPSNNNHLGFQRSATMLPSAAMRISPRAMANGHDDNTNGIVASPRKFNIQVENHDGGKDHNNDHHQDDDNDDTNNPHAVPSAKDDTKPRRGSLSPQPLPPSRTLRNANNMNIPIIRTVSLNPSSSSTLSLSARQHHQPPQQHSPNMNGSSTSNSHSISSNGTISPRLPSSARANTVTNTQGGISTPSKDHNNHLTRERMMERDGLTLSPSPRVGEGVMRQSSTSRNNNGLNSSRRAVDRVPSGLGDHSTMDSNTSMGLNSYRRASLKGAGNTIVNSLEGGGGNKMSPRVSPRGSPGKKANGHGTTGGKKGSDKKKGKREEDEDESSHSSQFLEQAGSVGNEDE